MQFSLVIIFAALLPFLQSCDSKFKSPVSAAPGPVPTTPARSADDYKGSDNNWYSWKPIRIGAGGWLTGIDFSPDGTTRVVRTDTYGAYLWDQSNARWKQLVTRSSMPASDLAFYLSQGVFEIRAAPSLPTRLYMSVWNFIYRSDDRGTTWTRTALTEHTMDGNGQYRTNGQKLTIDPVNPDVVYVGTATDGLFVSFNGGVSFQKVTAVPDPVAMGNGVTGIVFDSAGGTTSGRTNVIYAASDGSGVYRSVNAGASWSALAGGPTNVASAKLATDGILYVVGNNNAAVFKLSGTTWTTITPFMQNFGAIVTDPFNPARVIAVEYGGRLNVSADRGATWVGLNTVTRTAIDIPWLGWTLETYMSEGNLLFDPLVANRLWFSQGIGVWYADLPATVTGATPVAWQSQSIGIEQLVGNQVLSPTGGVPLVAGWDRPVFRVGDPDVFPSTHGPNRDYSINAAWSIDFAPATPTFVAGIINWFGGVERSGYSLDGGSTWQSFAAVPTAVSGGAIGGSMAVSTTTNIVWVPSASAAPSYTTDRGATWTACAGLPAAGTADWHWAHYLKRQIVAADRVTAGTFYLYSHVSGLYASTNGGASWTQRFAGPLNPNTTYNTKLRAVPGHAGHLFFSGGSVGGINDPHPAPSAPFMRSTDGGSTWTSVANVLEVFAFGFGKPKVALAYPAVYLAGYVNGAWGIYRSDDNAVSWVKIGEYPMGSLDVISGVEGDSNTFGLMYISFNGSGYAYSRLSE